MQNKPITLAHTPINFPSPLCCCPARSGSLVPRDGATGSVTRDCVGEPCCRHFVFLLASVCWSQCTAVKLFSTCWKSSFHSRSGQFIWNRTFFRNEVEKRSHPFSLGAHALQSSVTRFSQRGSFVLPFVRSCVCSFIHPFIHLFSSSLLPG